MMDQHPPVGASEPDWSIQVPCQWCGAEVSPVPGSAGVWRSEGYSLQPQGSTACSGVMGGPIDPWITAQLGSRHPVRTHHPGMDAVRQLQSEGKI